MQLKKKMSESEYIVIPKAVKSKEELFFLISQIMVQ